MGVDIDMGNVFAAILGVNAVFVPYFVVRLLSGCVTNIKCAVDYCEEYGGSFKKLSVAAGDIDILDALDRVDNCLDISGGNKLIGVL